MDKNIVYGPVSSWRFGRSLGIDIICGNKVCNFNCIYCQLGQSEAAPSERKVFVATEKVLEAVAGTLPEVEAEALTLSGMGEPTLAKNMGEIIDGLHEISSLPVVVLTNGSTMTSREVRQELNKADVVKAKLDAPDQETFSKLNNPHAALELEAVVSAMHRFAHQTDSYFVLEIMFTPQNMAGDRELALWAEAIEPDEIQINTPRRGAGVERLTDRELDLVVQPFEQRKLIYRAVHREKKPPVGRKFGKEKFKRLQRFSDELE